MPKKPMTRKPVTKSILHFCITSLLQVMIFDCCYGMEWADKVNLLHQEAAKGNDTAVRALLDDVEVDMSLTEGGVTALYRAASAGHRKTMHTLLLAGAQVNANVTDPLMDLDGAPYNLLKYAIRSGDVTAVENLLAARANLSSISANWNYTPLHDAVEKRRYNITQILLENKAKINADSVSGPVLSIASQQGNIDMIMLLLKYGADIDGAGTKKPPLIEAVIARKQDAALKLIEIGANLNASSEDGNNAIHIATKNGLKQIIEALIKKGLVNQKNKVGRTPLYFVQQPNTAHILLKGGAVVNAVTYKGETPLHYATHRGNYELVDLLVKNGATLDFLSNETYEMKELFEEHKELTRLLFRNSPRRTTNNTKGFSALAIAIFMKDSRLITFLIGKGSPLNLEGIEWPPMHVAAYCGEVSAIRILVEAGADIDVRDIIGWTPLHKAALKGSVKVVELLVRLGGQLDPKDLYGRTPLHVAAGCGRAGVVMSLIDSGADANIEDTVGFNALLWAVVGGHPYFLRLTIGGVSDMEPSKRYGYLQISAKRDVETIINETKQYTLYVHRFDEAILRDFIYKTIQDTNVNITDIGRRLDEYTSDKDRPLTVDKIQAIIESSFMDGRKLYLKMIAFIVNKTSSLDAEDTALGWTVLHWAAASGDIQLVKFLAGRGAFINAVSMFDQTPMFLARHWGHKDVYQFFKESGGVW